MTSARISCGCNDSLNKMDFYFSLLRKSGGRQSKAGEADLLPEVPGI